MAKETLRGPNGVKLILDSNEIFPDDPGQGTPAVVEREDFHATYWCAIGEGEWYSTQEEYRPIPKAILAWLNAKEEYVNAFIERNSPKTA